MLICGSEVGIMSGERKNLRQLFIPLCLETLCRMLVGMVDTMMTSSINDQAVGAVGTANTYIGIFIIMFGIISSGMLAVMTQFIGAGRNGVAFQARQAGAGFNFAFGALLSAVLFFFAGNILSMVSVADALMQPAETYFKIVGGFCVLDALTPIYSNYVRAYGHTKAPLAATIAGNLVNLGLNALFLYALNMGVAGIAYATVIAKLLGFVIVFFASRRVEKTLDNSERIALRDVIKKIIKIGLPSAMESALYNVAMMFTVRFLNQMDPDGMNVTARSYAAQISNFSFCAGAALAQANAILTGWRIGTRSYTECDKGTKRAAAIGVALAVGLEGLFALTSGFIMRIFTDDAQMISLVGTLLAIDIFLEIGRTSNLVFGSALKASGDALFTTIIAAVFMFLCAVGGTWFFGIYHGMMVTGAYIGLSLDECCRAFCMLMRWKSGKWRDKSLVDS